MLSLERDADFAFVFFTYKYIMFKDPLRLEISDLRIYIL